jgi:hypothetical protein
LKFRWRPSSPPHATPALSFREGTQSECSCYEADELRHAPSRLRSFAPCVYRKLRPFDLVTESLNVGDLARISAEFRKLFLAPAQTDPSLRSFPWVSPLDQFGQQPRKGCRGSFLRTKALRGAAAREGAGRLDQKISLTCEHVNTHVNTSQHVNSLTRAGLTPRTESARPGTVAGKSGKQLKPVTPLFQAEECGRMGGKRCRRRALRDRHQA